MHAHANNVHVHGIEDGVEKGDLKTFMETFIKEEHPPSKVVTSDCRGAIVRGARNHRIPTDPDRWCCAFLKIQ